MAADGDLTGLKQRIDKLLRETNTYSQIRDFIRHQQDTNLNEKGPARRMEGGRFIHRVVLSLQLRRVARRSGEKAGARSVGVSSGANHSARRAAKALRACHQVADENGRL